jgi:hypothetical protein
MFPTPPLRVSEPEADVDSGDGGVESSLSSGGSGDTDNGAHAASASSNPGVTC